MSYISRQQRRVIYIVGCLLWFTLTTHPFMIPWVPSSRSSCQRNLAEQNDVPPYLESFKGNSTNYIEDLKVVEKPPIPIMPSDLFQKMALSQLEVLANSLTRPGTVSESKVESMALYLPQENVNTGQLEFTPVVLYPDPKSERVFIAADAESGTAPTLPKALTKLPGFAHATTLLPGYPMISSSTELTPGVGLVEEVMCDPRFKSRAPALSVPLLSGSQTVGVLLVSAALDQDEQEFFWTEYDRQQVSSAAQSLSVALTMDNERNFLREQNRAFREGLSDSLHQVKNPLQALRTYGKILQRQMTETESPGGTPTRLLELVERLMTQSERVVDLMIPMDNLVNDSPLFLNPAKDPSSRSLVLFEQTATPLSEAESQNIEDFSRDKAGLIAFSPQPENIEFNNTDNGIHQFGVAERQCTSPNLFGEAETEIVFVADVLDPIFSAFQAIASEEDIEFEMVVESAELPGVMAAPKALQEAVSNILDNAVKYVVLPKEGSPFISNPSPKVRVRLFANTMPSGVTIVVEDNGPGVRKHQRDRIFKRGFRGDLTRSVEGSGIGLDISQALVRCMGGTLGLVDHGIFTDSLDGTVMALTLYR